MDLSFLAISIFFIISIFILSILLDDTFSSLSHWVSPNNFSFFINAALTSRKECSEIWLCIWSSSVHLKSQTEQSNSHCTNLNCSFFWYRCLYELIISRGVLLDRFVSIRFMVMMFSRFLVTGSTRRAKVRNNEKWWKFWVKLLV